MIVVLDNRDSFVFNLARHFQLLGPRVIVVPAHGTSVVAIRRLRPAAIVISPGPGTPTDAGCSLEVVRTFGGSVPILGVCLGHQAIAAGLGGRIVRGTPTHGRTSEILHDGTNLFAGIPNPMTAARYHSLVVEPHSLPESIVVTACDASGTIMAIADEPRAMYGVQFHPESILTRHGFRLLANFLDAARVGHRGRYVLCLDDDIADQATAAEPTPIPEGRVVTF